MLLRIVTVLVSIAPLFAGCTSPVELGGECTDTADCAAELSCFERFGDPVTMVCMQDCAYPATVLCEDGSICIAASGPERPPGLGLCYLGGAADVGARCTVTRDCVRGAVCVDENGDDNCEDGTCSCFVACDTADDACAATEVCAPLSGMLGFCMTTP